MTQHPEFEGDSTTAGALSAHFPLPHPGIKSRRNADLTGIQSSLSSSFQASNSGPNPARGLQPIFHRIVGPENWNWKICLPGPEILLEQASGAFKSIA
jgi:hypothetical protein